MYKKLLSVLLIIMVVVTIDFLPVTFAATHTHSYTTYVSTSSTHTAGQGHAVTKKCSCGALSIQYYSTGYSGCCSCGNHSYYQAYEAAHPHKGYTKCSKCGNWWYNGQTQSVSTCCSCVGHNFAAATCTKLQTCTRCGAQTGTLAAHNYSTYVSTSATHTAGQGHAVTKKCSCGATSIQYYSTGYSGCCDCGNHSYYQAYEAAHPHKGYTKCSKCGNWWYNGQTQSVSTCCSCVGHQLSTNDYYDASVHPHQHYQICSRCNTKVYRDNEYTTDVDGCCSCGNHDFTIVNICEDHTVGEGHAIIGKCSRCATVDVIGYDMSYNPCCLCGNHILVERIEHIDASNDRYYELCSICGAVAYSETIPCQHHICSYTKQYGPHTSTGHEYIMVCSCGNSYTPGKAEKEADPTCLSCVTPPTTSIVNINADTCLSEADTSFKLQINVQDNENDTLTCNYYLDNGATSLGTEVVSGTSTTKTVTFTNGIDAAALSEGQHTLKVIVKDSIAPAGIATITFNVDKSNPRMSAEVNSTMEGATISVTASDDISGLDNPAYRYTIGNETTDWLTGPSYTTVGKLSPNSCYSYKVEVKDKKQHTTSQSGTFYTKAQMPGINISAASNKSLTLNLVDNNPTNTEYNIMVGTQSLSSSGYLVDGTYWITVPSKTIDLVGLSPNTNYTVVVKARNSEGVELTEGQTASAATLPLPPVSATGLKAISSSKTSITLAWEATEGATGYDLMRDSSIIENVTTPYVDSELEIASTHEYKIRAKNCGGESEWSEVYTAATLPNPPQKITEVTCSTEAAITINVTWTLSEDADSYDVEINGINSLNTTGAAIQVPYSQFNSQYTIRVRGVNSGGTGDWSEPLITYTPANKPDGATISEVKYNSINVSWSSNANTDSVAYKVGIFDLSGNLIKENSYTANLQDCLSGLEGGTTYILKIKAKNSDSVETEWSSETQFTTKISPPEMPSQIRATAKDKQIVLFWEAGNRASAYEVRRDGTVIAANITQTSFTDIGLTPDTAYLYEVRAVNDSGVSCWSLPLTKTTLGALPQIPTGLTVTGSSISIQIAWNSDDNVTGYELEVDGKIISTDLNTQYEHNGLIPGTYHTYRVRARNINGKSEWTELITKQTTPNIPSIPANIYTIAADNGFTIKWTNTDSSCDYFEAEVDGNIAKTKITASEAIISGLESGTTHNYRIRSVNAGGSSDWSQINYVNTLSTLVNVPAVQASATANSVKVTWNNVSNAIGYQIEVNGAEPITLGEITVTTDGAITVTGGAIVVTTSGAITVFDHTGLKSGETNTYRVRAIVSAESGAEAGAWSVLKSITTLPETPSITLAPSTNMIMLEWTSIPGSTFYQVEADGQIKYSGPGCRYTDLALLPGTSHTYRIRAGNESGFSEFSNLETINTKKEVTNIPQKLIQSKMNNGVITVTWEPVEGVSEYSIEINGTKSQQYVKLPLTCISTTPGAIYMVRVASVLDTATGTVSEWSDELTFMAPLGIPATPSAMVSYTTGSAIEICWNSAENAEGYEVQADGKIYNIGNSNIYTDSGLAPESSHQYSVRAYNETGTSAWSEVLSVSTDIGMPGVPLNISCKDIESQTTSGAAIQVSWKEVTGAISYEIDNMGEIQSTSGSAITIDGLKHGTKYDIRVRAITEGGTGPWSSNISCVTQLETSTEIIASSENGVIHITWNSVEGATGYDVEMDGVLIGTTSSSGITVTQGSVYVTHSFRIRAHNSFVTGNWSEPSLYNQSVPVLVNVQQGEEISVYLPVSNVANINKYKMVITVNLDEVELLDACELTPTIDISDKYISENNMQLIIEQNGNVQTITMLVNIKGSEGVLWTGTINSIKLKAKKTGTITIKYCVEYLQ